MTLPAAKWIRFTGEQSIQAPLSRMPQSRMSSAGGELLVDSLFPSDTVQMKPAGDGAVTVAPGTEP